MRKWLCVDRVEGIEAISAIVWAPSEDVAYELACDRRELVTQDPMSVGEFKRWYRMVDVTDLEDCEKPAWKVVETVELGHR